MVESGLLTGGHKGVRQGFKAIIDAFSSLRIGSGMWMWGSINVKY